MGAGQDIIRDPLCTTELEFDLLGALMRENELVEQVADVLKSSDFGVPLHGVIYDHIVSEVSQSRPANPITLKGYLEGALQSFGGIKYLAEMTGNLSVMSVESSVRHLVEMGKRRRMRADLKAASDACADMAVKPAEIIGMADSAISDDATDSIVQLSGAECFEELVASFDEPTLGTLCNQIPSLDDLHGPLRPKQMVVMAGRPGMGKTAVALSYCIGAAWSGHGVLFVSLEMSSRELAARMAADMCFEGSDGVPYSAIRDGKVNSYQRRKVTEAGVQMARLPLNVVDAGGLTVGRLHTLVRRWKRRMEARGTPLELVVVDYLGLMHGDQKGRGRYEEVTEISQRLKSIAKDEDVAVLALAQLSREVEKRPDKRPMLSDLRDSGSIEQDADSVIFLLRQEYYLRAEEPDEMDPKRAVWDAAMDQVKGQIEFILAKCRNGVTGNAIGHFHGAYQAVR